MLGDYIMLSPLRRRLQVLSTWAAVDAIAAFAEGGGLEESCDIACAVLLIIIICISIIIITTTNNNDNNNNDNDNYY